MKENINPCPHRVVGDPCPSCQEEAEKYLINKFVNTINDFVEVFNCDPKISGLPEGGLSLKGTQSGRMNSSDKTNFSKCSFKQTFKELDHEQIANAQKIIENWENRENNNENEYISSDSQARKTALALESYTTTITVPKNRSENPTTNIVPFDDDDFDDCIEDLTVEECKHECKQSKTKCTHKSGYTTLVRGKLYCTECIMENLIPVGDI